MKNEWMNKLMKNKWTNEWINEKWKNKWMKGWHIEWIDIFPSQSINE